MEMMEGRSHLNQRLQKAFLRLFERKPDTLPMLMSKKELASQVAGESFSERVRVPVKLHAFSLCDRA